MLLAKLQSVIQTGLPLLQAATEVAIGVLQS